MGIMKIATVKRDTGDVLSVLEPEFHSSVIYPEDGTVLVVVDSHDEAKTKTGIEIIDTMQFDLKTGRFLPKAPK